MPSLVPKLIKIYKKAFDIERKKLNTVSDLRLIAEDGGATDYVEILKIEGGWKLEFNSFRQRPEVFISTDTDEFYLLLENSGFFSIDGDVYEFSKADLAPPGGSEPYFRVLCSRTGKKFDIS